MAVKDIPALLTERQVTIYQNGLNLIVPTQAQAPAGKVAHGVLLDDLIESSINRVTDYRLLNLRGYFNTLRTYGDGETTVGSDFVIYMNVSGGNLLGVDPTVPGNSGTSTPPEPWRPITNGPPPAFGIPLWNGDGLTTDGVGNPITNGTGVYLDSQLVRADNGIYQRNDNTLPAPVSTDFLSEAGAGKWTFIGTIIPLPLSDFQDRLAAGELSPTRLYFITDRNIFVQATNVNSYSQDAKLLADYSALSRATIEIERINYDAVNDVIKERWDNYGNYASQFSLNVNGSGQPANAVDRAPWGSINFNNNILRDCYIVNAYTQSKIGSFTSNNLNDGVINHTHSGGPTFTFDNNFINAGTFTLSNIASMIRCTAMNGGTVAPLASISNAFSSSPGATSTKTGAISLAEGSTASGTRAVALGYNSTASGDESITLGTSSQALGSNAASLGTGAIASGASSFAVGSLSTASGINSITLGKNSIASGDYGIAFNFAARALINNSRAFAYDSASNQEVDTTLGAITSSTSVTKLLTQSSGGTLAISNTFQSTWQFEGMVAAHDRIGLKYASWYFNGLLKDIGGTVTLVGNVLFLKNDGTWSTSVATRYDDGVWIPTLAVTTGTNELIINVTSPNTNQTGYMGNIKMLQFN